MNKNDIRISDNIFTKLPTIFNGKHITVDRGLYCTTQLHIGSYVHIGPNVTIIGGKDSKLILEDFSAIAAGSVIICGSDDYTSGGLLNPTVPIKYRDVILTTITFEKYSCCGVNCSIFPGVTISEGSVIGAGSVISKTTTDWGIYFGNPARLIGRRPKEIVLEHVKNLLEERGEVL